LYRSILLEPKRFCGLKHARRGLLTSAFIALLIATLLAITVPARLKQRQVSIEAGIQARAYAYDLAFFEYQKRFKTLPDRDNLKPELSQMPDPDGQIAPPL